MFSAFIWATLARTRSWASGRRLRKGHDPVAGEAIEDLVAPLQRADQVVAAGGALHRGEQLRAGFPSGGRLAERDYLVFQSMTPTL